MERGRHARDQARVVHVRKRRQSGAGLTSVAFQDDSLEMRHFTLQQCPIEISITAAVHTNNGNGRIRQRVVAAVYNNFFGGMGRHASERLKFIERNLHIYQDTGYGCYQGTNIRFKNATDSAYSEAIRLRQLAGIDQHPALGQPTVKVLEYKCGIRGIIEARDNVTLELRRENTTQPNAIHSS